MNIVLRGHRSIIGTHLASGHIISPYTLNSNGAELGEAIVPALEKEPLKLIYPRSVPFLLSNAPVKEFGE